MSAVEMWAQAPTGLTVRTATSKRVDLSWSGSSASYLVQRRVLGGSFSTLQAVSAATFSDTSIDAYTTYQYQIVAGTGVRELIAVESGDGGSVARGILHRRTIADAIAV